uniref:Domain of unknown function DB domain-containing protein n=1 Tax=Parascaris equorum TaxID=6256 RepID=A0A914S4I9_PAREQ
MPQPVCTGGCGPGYGCGQYGCYSRARARSSKTFTGGKSKEADAEFVEVGHTPDEKFHTCCVDRHLPDACLQKCSFATYTKEALQRPGNITQLDMSYLSCYERFENIKGCFWHSLNEMRSSESAKSLDSF